MPDALKFAVTTACRHNLLKRGLNECARQLEKGNSVLCIVSSSITEIAFAQLVPALCAENHIPMLTVDDSRTLAIWAGLATFDDDGEVLRVNRNGCSVVVISGWDESNAHVGVIKEYIAAQRSNTR